MERQMGGSLRVRFATETSPTDVICKVFIGMTYNTMGSLDV